jgi:hypothetical protein
MERHWEILERAISDVGYWTWWTQDFPKSFQVEFGGTQLWNPPKAPDKPPSGQLALRFIAPRSVSFLVRRGAGDLSGDWPELLHADALEPFTINHEHFALMRPEAAREVLTAAARVETRFGAAPTPEAIGEWPAVLAFFAGPAGLLVGAESLMAVSHAGEIRPEQIEPASERWWAYWKEYWRRRETASPLPRDYACEVTIPTGE